MFGIDVDAQEHVVRVHPQLPADWNEASVERLHVGDSICSLEYARRGSAMTVRMKMLSGPPVRVTSTVRGAKTAADGLVVSIPLPAVELGVAHGLPLPGARTAQMKVLSEVQEERALRRELEGLDPKLTPKQKDEIVRKRYEDAGAPDWFPSQEARSVAHDVEGNPAETLQKVMELYGTDKSVSGFTPRQLYYELPGEIEARNVQARRDMTPAELKAKPPWETAGMDARPIMSRLFGGGRVGSLEGPK